LRYNKNILACTISATNAQTATAQLTNAEGKTIYNTNAFEITETPTPIAIAINKKLSNGIYFVRVITQDGKQITQKMMVND
jgi:methionine-rich copper-binding protein CopC